MKKANYSSKGGRALADIAREVNKKPANNNDSPNLAEIQQGEMLKLNDPIL